MMTIGETRSVGWKFLALYAFGYTGIWVALLTPVLVSIALKLRQLSPGSAVQDLALVLSVGAVVAIVSNPIFGHLSDRTRSRFGRRRPWLLAGMFCGTLALVIVAQARNAGVVLAGWCLAQLAFNAVLAAMVAVLPDQVPERERGTVSGIISVCLPIGQALGSVAVRATADDTLLTFLLPALLGCAAVLVFALWLPDDAQPPPSSPFSLRDSLRGFWVDPRQYPDFGWACLSRFLIAMGSAFVTTYLPYYLIEGFGIAQERVADHLSQAVVIQTVMMVLAGLVSGKLSDVVQRRKVFVFAGGLFYAAGLCLVALAPNYQSLVIGMAIAGIGHGAYFGTDLALVTGVLRSRPHASGKDLGFLNVANTLPQSLTPALGSFVLLATGGNYPVLFVLAGVSALLSSLAITPLRTVR
jgi:MFS family permease